MCATDSQIKKRKNFNTECTEKKELHGEIKKKIIRSKS